MSADCGIGLQPPEQTVAAPFRPVGTAGRHSPAAGDAIPHRGLAISAACADLDQMLAALAHRAKGRNGRTGAEAGFTLIELLVVLVVIGVLLAIAVPSYLGFADRGADSAARSNLRTAMSAAEAYYVEHTTYVGMDRTALTTIDGGLSPTLTVVTAASASYCLTDTIHGRTWSLAGPGAAPINYFRNGTCT